MLSASRRFRDLLPRARSSGVPQTRAGGLFLKYGAQIDDDLHNIDLGDGYLHAMELVEVEDEVDEVLEFFVGAFGPECGDALDNMVVELHVAEVLALGGGLAVGFAFGLLVPKSKVLIEYLVDRLAQVVDSLGCEVQTGP